MIIEKGDTIIKEEFGISVTIMAKIKIPCRDIHYPHEGCLLIHWFDTETKVTWTE